MSRKMFSYKKKRSDRERTIQTQTAQSIFSPKPFGIEETNEVSQSSPVDLQAQLESARKGFKFADMAITPPKNAFPAIQRKLTVGKANDKYEQEADQVASQVVDSINSSHSNGSQGVQRQEESVAREEKNTGFKYPRQIVPREDNQRGNSFRNPNPLLQRMFIQKRSDIDVSQLAVKPSYLQRQGMEQEEDLQMKPKETTLQREEMKEEEDLQMKPTLQRVGHEGGTVSPDLESEINNAKVSGQALEPGLQESMGQEMGADFSGVTVHNDSKSDQLNTALQAKAFTTGQDVFFKQGEYQPHSQEGQKLIAHELTHVEQQKGQGGNLNRHQVVQRLIPSQEDKNSSNKEYHVSDDHKMIVGAQAYNNHDLYATNDKIKESQAALKKQKARFQMKKGSQRTFKFQDEITEDITLNKVIPENIGKKSKGTGKNWWDEDEKEFWYEGGMLTPHACDKTAKMVLGGSLSLVSALGPENKKEKADIEGGGRLNLQLGAFSLIVRAMDNLYANSDALTSKENKFLKYYTKLYGGNKFSKKIHAGNVEDELKEFFNAIKGNSNKAPKLKNKQLLKKIAQTLQTHSFAMPKVGQGLVMLSAGEDLGSKTWPYHYAGVIMTSGSDYVTLENFAVSGKDAAYNTEWKYDIYGPRNQSFQFEHKATKQHGDMPVTFVVEGGGYKNWPKGYKPNRDHGTK